jgi:hypothetical protein
MAMIRLMMPQSPMATAVGIIVAAVECIMLLGALAVAVGGDSFKYS